MKQYSVLVISAVILFAQSLLAIEYAIPVLTVNDKNEGACLRLPIAVTQNSGTSPLRVTVSDDTPSGSGSSARCSVWLAAITAAMQRSDALCGVRIAVDFSGNMDGPSAGGVLCLAILTALDKRDFPEDFAMTGTIMPDGTIGVVGGVALKMKAAAAAGIKRLCIPAFLRNEKQADGQSIDLYRYGEKLGLQMHPVENISQAYRILHKIPAVSQQIPNERQICALSQETENALNKIYQQHYLEVQKKLKTVKKEFLDLLRNDKSSASLFPEKAENAFQRGRLLSAVEAIVNAKYAWAILTKHVTLCEKEYHKFLKLGDPEAYQTVESYRKDLMNFKAVADNKIEEQMSFWLKNGGAPFYPDHIEMKESSAQMEECHSIPGIFSLLNCIADDELKNPKLSKEDLNVVYQKLMADILFLTALDFWEERDKVYRLPLVKTMPQITVNDSAPQVEQFFYSARIATAQSIETDIIDSCSAELDITPNKFKLYLNKNDHNYLFYFLANIESEKYHRKLADKNNLMNYNYHLVASLISQTEILSRACAVLIKYGPEIRAFPNDSEDTQYENADFIHYLIRSARFQALLSIQECQKHKIPCLISIKHFEFAELYRDDNDADKIHDILEQYWLASLTAKALVMSFQR